MKPEGNGDGKLAVAARIGEEADQLIEVEDFAIRRGSDPLFSFFVNLVFLERPPALRAILADQMVYPD